MDLSKTMMISASGMRAQASRMRVIAENIANANSIASGEGDTPYRRRMVSFKSAMDRELGVPMVEVKKVEYDSSPFGRKYEPGHPAADADGYVTTPNVNALLERNDMRQAQRSYQANMSSVEAAKSMMMRTLDLLR